MMVPEGSHFTNAIPECEEYRNFHVAKIREKYEWPRKCVEKTFCQSGM